jgi:ubiquinone/menaquinone biosynthesis C-methylase UbiE
MFSQEEEKEIIDIKHVGQHDSVLDVACGTGVTTITAARKTITIVMGLDITPELLIRAKQQTDIVGIKKEQDKTNLSPHEVNKHDYNVISYSKNFSQRKNKITSRNFENVVNYQQTIKTMKEIKCNYMEEHKNIVNTYYSIYSKHLDDIIYHNLKNSKTIEEYSNTCNEINQYRMNNQTNTTTRMINDIIDKNMDTFIKSIKFANKFYFDVVQSYYNYIMTINKSSER